MKQQTDEENSRCDMNETVLSFGSQAAGLLIFFSLRGRLSSFLGSLSAFCFDHAKIHRSFEVETRV